MDWSKGYSATYYATVVDKDTWKDIDRIEITGGSILRSLDDLMQSADIKCVNYQETREQWIRIWLDVRQEGGASAHVPLFTGLATSPSKDINGRLVNNTVQCYSVLKPAQDVLLDRGWYAPVGIEAGLIVEDLLKVIGTGISITIEPDSPELKESIVAENNENHLSMALTILDAVGWDLKIRGDGSIDIGPISSTPIARFDSVFYDVLETSLTVTYDWYDCPNVFRGISNGVSAVARDDDPDSPYSTVTRGREVWAEETNCILSAGASIGDYAITRLKELQQVSTTISYDRRYIPDVYTGDIVTINYPAQGISGNYFIKSQKISLGYSAKTSEEVVQV